MSTRSTGDEHKRRRYRSRIVGDLRMDTEAAARHVKPIEPSVTAGAPASAEAPVSIILELNVAHPGGLSGVREALFRLFAAHATDPVALPQMPGDLVEPETPP